MNAQSKKLFGAKMMNQDDDTNKTSPAYL